MSKSTQLKNIVIFVAMGFLGIYSIYSFVTMYGWAFFAQFGFLITQPIFAAPGLALLSMFMFSVLYLYVFYKHKAIPGLARGIAGIFTVLILLALAILLIGVIQDVFSVYCAGFFGVQTSCLSNQYITIGILLLMHPLVFLAYLLLALTGTGSLISSLRGKR